MVGDQPLNISVGGPIRLLPQDMVCVATDGVLDNMLPERWPGALKGGTSQKKAEAFGQAVLSAMQTGKMDDATFLLCQPGKAPRP